MPVSWDDLQSAFEFVSSGEPGEQEAVLNCESGELFWRSELTDLDEWPDDVDDRKMYTLIPHKKELGLGRSLVFDFVEENLPDQFDEVQRLFSRRGAYAGFKELLQRNNALEQWRAFEAEASEKALREWCEFNDIVIDDKGREAAPGARSTAG
jgi:hypothetical protein